MGSVDGKLLALLEAIATKLRNSRYDNDGEDYCVYSAVHAALSEVASAIEDAVAEFRRHPEPRDG